MVQKILMTLRLTEKQGNKLIPYIRRNSHKFGQCGVEVPDPPVDFLQIKSEQDIEGYFSEVKEFYER